MAVTKPVKKQSAWDWSCQNC